MLPLPFMSTPLPKLPTSDGLFGMIPALLVLGLGLLGAEAVSAQQVFRPSSVWGEVPVEHEGLVLGSVELLTSMLIGLFTTWLLTFWLLLEKWRWWGRAQRLGGSEAGRILELTENRRRLLAWITYGVVPIMGIVAILAAGHRTLFGIEVALIATVLALASIVTGLGAFLLSASLRARLELRAG